MKKKGFTLVELLAVIAILAILVIIALPNVMGMFNNAKKSSFETEIKEIIKGAQQQWMMDSVSGTAAQASKTYSSTGTKLTSVDVRSTLTYSITLNGVGKITEAKFTDGTYGWGVTGASDIKGETVGAYVDGKTCPVETIAEAGNGICNFSSSATNAQKHPTRNANDDTPFK